MSSYKESLKALVDNILRDIKKQLPECITGIDFIEIHGITSYEWEIEGILRNKDDIILKVKDDEININKIINEPIILIEIHDYLEKNYDKKNETNPALKISTLTTEKREYFKKELSEIATGDTGLDYEVSVEDLKHITKILKELYVYFSIANYYSVPQSVHSLYRYDAIQGYFIDCGSNIWLTTSGNNLKLNAAKSNDIVILCRILLLTLFNVGA